MDSKILKTDSFKILRLEKASFVLLKNWESYISFCRPHKSVQLGLFLKTISAFKKYLATERKKYVAAAFKTIFNQLVKP